MSSDKPSLYVRVLRLERVRPGAFVSFLLFECAITVAVLLALAELVSWWAVPLLPLTIAGAMKVNDMVAGTLAGPRRSDERRTAAGRGSLEVVPPVDDELDWDIPASRTPETYRRHAEPELEWDDEWAHPLDAWEDDELTPTQPVWSDSARSDSVRSDSVRSDSARSEAARSERRRVPDIDRDVDTHEQEQPAAPMRQRLQLTVVLPNPDGKDERARTGAALIRRTTGRAAGTKTGSAALTGPPAGAGADGTGEPAAAAPAAGAAAAGGGVAANGAGLAPGAGMAVNGGGVGANGAGLAPGAGMAVNGGGVAADGAGGAVAADGAAGGIAVRRVFRGTPADARRGPEVEPAPPAAAPAIADQPFEARPARSRVYGRRVEEPQDYSQPVEESRTYRRPIEASRVYGEPVEETPVYGHPVRESRLYGRPVEESQVYGRPVEERRIYAEPVDEPRLYGQPSEDAQAYGQLDVEPTQYAQQGRRDRTARHGHDASDRPAGSGRHARDADMAPTEPVRRWTTTYGERRNEVPGRRRATATTERETTVERRMRDANAKQGRFA